MLEKMKEFMQLRQKMQSLNRSLEETFFEVKSSDGLVKIVMSGAQKIKDIRIDSPLEGVKKDVLESSLKEAIEKAIAHSQHLAAKEMQKSLGFSLPNLW